MNLTEVLEQAHKEYCKLLDECSKCKDYELAHSLITQASKYMETMHQAVRTAIRGE